MRSPRARLPRPTRRWSRRPTRRRAHRPARPKTGRRRHRQPRLPTGRRAHRRHSPRAGRRVMGCQTRRDSFTRSAPGTESRSALNFSKQSPADSTGTRSRLSSSVLASLTCRPRRCCTASTSRPSVRPLSPPRVRHACGKRSCDLSASFRMRLVGHLWPCHTSPVALASNWCKPS